MAIQGKGADSPGGVVGASLQETVDNISLVNQEGMKDVDSVIIGILESRG
jgi:L-cysteine desulfidase